MKKYSVLVVVVLLASLFVAPGVSGQSIEWTSGFQVQNLNDSVNAGILIYYYNQDGTLAIDPPVSDSVPMGASKNYYPIHASAPFNGSVVVESDQPIVAIANTAGDFPQYGASTESFSEGASSVKLPLIMRNVSGYYTWFNVQNASSSDDAVVTIDYVPQTGNAHSEGPVTIKPGASHTFSQKDVTALGSVFLGAATVSTSPAVPIVATVMQVGETDKTLMGYNGFVGGSKKVSLPLVMSNNSGYWTGIQVQNIGTGDTTITVSFGSNLAGSFAPTDQQVEDLPAGQSATFLQNTGQFETETYVGSATITSDREPVVAIVNQGKLGGTYPVATAYNGFNPGTLTEPGTATNRASAPLIMANNSGYDTGIQVMNVGDAATDLTIRYGPNIAGTWQPTDHTVQDLPVGDSYNEIQNINWTTNLYVGSLTVEAETGAKIVMIVNELSATAAGDQFFTYGGFNY